MLVGCEKWRVMFCGRVKTKKILRARSWYNHRRCSERIPVPLYLHFFSQFFMNKSTRMQRGFTLIELLLVIGIIAILASIVIVAINPTKQLGDARNAQRRSDVNTVLNAVYQYAIDNNGNLPSSITTTTGRICQSGMTAAEATTAGCIELDVLTGSYLVRMPVDPQVTATGTGTRYTIGQDSNGRITVTAYGAEQGESISVTR